MKNRPLWLWLAPVITALFLTGLLLIEPVREYIFTIILDSYFFIKKNIIAILTAFFLIKGKFVIQVFLRKILLLSATGLGKRYMVERVLTHNFKVHFTDHLKDDFKRLAEHIKLNFMEFPLIKKVMTLFAFVGSLGFMGKFMGSMLAVKVFIAKTWSFLLAVFLKVFSTLFYFLSKVVWGSWLAPVFEVVVFSWFLNWMEKVPFLKRILTAVNGLFRYLFGGVEKLIARLMRAPLRRFLKWLVRKMKIAIYTFIGYERVSLYQRLQEDRKLNPNAHITLMQARKERMLPRREHLSAREQLKEKRKRRKPLNKNDFS